MSFTGQELVEIVRDCKTVQEAAEVIRDMRIDEIEALVGHVLDQPANSSTHCPRRSHIIN